MKINWKTNCIAPQAFDLLKVSAGIFCKWNFLGTIDLKPIGEVDSSVEWRFYTESLFSTKNE